MKKLTIQEITKCDNCPKNKDNKDAFKKISNFNKDQFIAEPLQIDYEKLEASKKILFLQDSFFLKIEYKLPGNAKSCKAIKNQLETRINCKLAQLTYMLLKGNQIINNEQKETGENK